MSASPTSTLRCVLPSPRHPASSHTQQFAEKRTVDEIQNMLRVNCMSTTLMTGLVLPGMKERKSGAVVCVSSGLAAVPSPLYAVYGATKAFVGSYANAVAVECARSNTNGSVQELSPFFVATSALRPSLPCRACRLGCC